MINKSQQEYLLSLKKRYVRLSQDNPVIIGIIDSAELSEHIYNSNAIENSTLSLEETEKILLEIELDRYVTPREIFEAKNLERVMKYISNNNDKKLSIDLILLLHQMLMSNIDNDIAGRFREGNELVRVGSHIAPHPNEIMEKIPEMLLNFYNADTTNIISKVALLHLEFEYLHPFIDGNGRIGRVINNYALLEAGYPPINIKFINRAEYYDTFTQYDRNGKISGMEIIIYRALLNSLHKRLAYLEGKKIITLNDYKTIAKTSYSNLLNKAKRQTIVAFLEKNTWKIGI
jgi:Fic family protein